MLPDRSKRFVEPENGVPRLMLASNGQLLVIAFLVIFLLVMIFPRKALVEKLYAQQTLDELTLSYIQNLYRADTRNADVALLLARSQQDKLSTSELEGFLLSMANTGDARQRTEAIGMLMDRYQQGLADKTQTRAHPQLRARAKELLTAVATVEMAPALAARLATFAFEWDLPQLGLVFFAEGEGGRSVKVLERYAEVALAQGQYAMSSDYFLLAHLESSDPAEARRLFILGIETLMEGGLYKAAMSASARQLGDLQDDPAVLRFLVRTALAADDAAMAAEYGRRLVFAGRGRKVSP